MPKVSPELAALVDARILARIKPANLREAELALRLKRDLTKMILGLNYVSVPVNDFPEQELDEVFRSEIEQRTFAAEQAIDKASEELRQAMLQLDYMLECALMRAGGEALLADPTTMQPAA